MKISTNDWLNYISTLRKLSDTAAEKMQQYVQKNGFADTERLIDYAYALATKYGEGSAELACQMYDAVAEMSKANVEAAVPAATATYQETARAIQGSLLQSPSGQKLTQVASRLVKQSAADTTVQNALRDHAEWAWIPSGGETCGFCIALAANGWQRASKNMLRGNHASHIHANCDCQFAIRFGKKGDVVGYNSAKYKKMYDEAEGSNSKEKMKSLRKQLEDRDVINAQKRAAYANNKKEKIKKEMYALSGHHVNQKDELYEKLENVRPYKDYEDYGIHGVPEKESVMYETTNGQETLYTGKEYAEIIKQDPNYHGGKVRLLSCGMGNENSKFIQEFANELGVEVMAPTETLWIGNNGELFISDNDYLADMWYNDGKIDNSINQTGRWRFYSPKKR